MLLFCGAADAVLFTAGAIKVGLPLAGVLRALTPGLLTMAAAVVMMLLAALLQLRLDAAEPEEAEETEPMPCKRPQQQAVAERPVYFPVREDTQQAAEESGEAAEEEEGTPRPKTQFFKLN